MIIDLDKIQALIDNDKITGYRIMKETGVPKQTISLLRTKQQKLENLTANTLLKLQEFVEKEEEEKA